MSQERMKMFVREITWLCGMSHGWGNGYVVIPEGHPLHGVGYEEIETEKMPYLDVHGGLTFAGDITNIDWEEVPEGCEGGWVVGFDTGHYMDTSKNWTKEKVIQETEKLRTQLEEYNV